ncbi:hypothetical protein C8R44DRAFT_887882 [Mycena epipterygia]|nr:hypothetical protein C8R44DRAFT_887882 [Mycena epipterygia]
MYTRSRPPTSQTPSPPLTRVPADSDLTLRDSLVILALQSRWTSEAGIHRRALLALTSDRKSEGSGGAGKGLLDKAMRYLLHGDTALHHSMQEIWLVGVQHTHSHSTSKSRSHSTTNTSDGELDARFHVHFYVQMWCTYRAGFEPRYPVITSTLINPFLLRPFQFSPFLPHDCVSFRVFFAYILYFSSIHFLLRLSSFNTLNSLIRPQHPDIPIADTHGPGRTRAAAVVVQQSNDGAGIPRHRPTGTSRGDAYPIFIYMSDSYVSIHVFAATHLSLQPPFFPLLSQLAVVVPNMALTEPGLPTSMHHDLLRPTIAVLRSPTSSAAALCVRPSSTFSAPPPPSAHHHYCPHHPRSPCSASDNTRPDQQGRLLPAGTICSNPHNLEAAPRALWRARRCKTSTRSTPSRRAPEPLPAPSAPRAARDAAVRCRPHRLHRLPCTRPFSASVPPSPLEACTCRAPRYQLYDLLRPPRAPWPFPIASASLIASSCAKGVFNKQTPLPFTRALPRICRTTQPTPDVLRTWGSHTHRPHPPRAPPPSPASHHLLSGTQSTVWSTTRVRRAFSASYAGFVAFPRAHIICGDAGLRPKPPPETSTSRAPFPPELRPRGPWG